MLVNEMEALLKNLDARVGRIEQILPTLATKADLDRFATKDDLRGAKNELMVLIEDGRAENRLVAEYLSGLMERVSDLTDSIRRLEDRAG